MPRQPMFRLPALATIGALALGSAGAFASDLTDLDTAQRDALRSEIRAYLLENPEVLMEAIGILEDRQAAELAQGDAELLSSNADALLNDGHSWVGGNPDGDITVVEFLDYRCGYCKRAHPEVAKLLESDGNIRLIVKEFPILGEQSVMASQFAIAVLRLGDSDSYEIVNDRLMTMRANIGEPALRTLAEEVGLDYDTLADEMASPEVAEIISENRALAEALQINGTPSFVFGDQVVRGYVPLDGMQGIVATLRDE